jgi:hypothetical protein
MAQARTGSIGSMHLGNIFASKRGGYVSCIYEWIGPEATMRRVHPRRTGASEKYVKIQWGHCFFRRANATLNFHRLGQRWDNEKNSHR